MLKVYDLVKILKNESVDIISRDAVDLLVGSAEEVLLDDSNLAAWALGNKVYRYDSIGDVHTIVCLESYEKLPTVAELLGMVSGVKNIGVHFDECNEIYSVDELINQHGNSTVTNMHICDRGMDEHFNIELWLID